LLKAATFTSNPPITTSVATWGPAALKQVYASLKCAPKHVILDPALYASVMFNTTGGCCFPLTTDRGPGAYGFGSISENSYWTGADAGLMGIGFCPQAIALVSGVPASSPLCSAQSESRTFTIPGIGLTAQFTTWCDANSGFTWGRYDIVLGVAKAVDCAMVLIIPAATLLAATEAQRNYQAGVDTQIKAAKDEVTAADKLPDSDPAKAGKLALAKERVSQLEEAKLRSQAIVEALPAEWNAHGTTVKSR
jgi:hypothetical protein